MGSKCVYLSLIISFFLFVDIKASEPDFSWVPDLGRPNLNWINDVGAKTFVTGDDYLVPVDANSGIICTHQVQETIDKCSRNGGGRVVFQPGEYIIGSIYIKEGVDLHIGKNVTLISSTDFKDFPRSRSRIAGIEMTWPDGLINILSQENASISGEGDIDCRGKFCWDKYWTMRKDYETRKLRWIVDYDCERIRGIVVNNSKNITLKDFKIKRTGFWAIQIVYSQYCTVSGLNINNNVGGHGPSTDGIDVDSSERILIENCEIDCNDDNICIKSGRDWDGLRVNRPCEYIVIRNCTAYKGGGLITCGSETSGGIRNIVAYNLKSKGTSAAIRFKSALNRGGFIKNVYISGVLADSVDNVIVADLNWNPSYSYSTLPPEYKDKKIPDHWTVMLKRVEPEEKGYPSVSDLYIENVQSTYTRRSFANISGMSELFPLKNLWLNNLNGNAKTAGTLKNTENVYIRNFYVETEDKSSMKLSGNKNMNGEPVFNKMQNLSEIP